jgi:ATP phosphoribosyltransferase regulatory subunit
MPPLLEHLESLLTGTGEALDLQTFKLVDQLSGRMMGLRADTTPQVARIDAHLLNRQGVRACATAARCCTPARPAARHARAAAVRRRDLRPRRPGSRPRGLLLALDCLKATQVERPHVDMADARIVRSLLGGVPWTPRAGARARRAGRQGRERTAQLTRAFPRPRARACWRCLALRRREGAGRSGQGLPAARPCARRWPT